MSTTAVLRGERAMRIMQVNLGRGQTASQECLREALHNNFSILLLQEPYVGKRGFTNMGKYKVIQSCNGNKPVKSAIVIVSDKLVIAEHPSLCNENITCVTAIWGKYRLGLVSVYLEGTEDIEPYLQHIQRAVEEMRTPHIILAGDVNARSNWWGEFEEDDRGRAYVELLAQLNMAVINTGRTPTFSAFRNNRAYESIVDVTACTHEIQPSISKWQVNTGLVTTSDHRAITFEVDVGSNTEVLPRQTTRKYFTAKADWQIFDETLQKALIERHITVESCKTIMNPEALNRFVEDFTACVSQACTSAIPSVSKHKIRKIKWWTDTLEKQKTEVIRRRNKIRGANPRRKPFVIEEYARALEEYKENIIKTRIGSWKDHCTSQKKTTMWQDIYKTLTATNRQSDTLLKDQTGKFLDPLQSASLLMDTFYSKDDPELDTGEQSDLRVRTAEHIALLRRRGQAESTTRKFEEHELQNVLRKFGVAKAPGEDGLTADICCRAVAATGDLFLTITNRCLELGCFPVKWKTAIVRIIPKPLKDDYSSPKSYRPIGLLPVFGKALEKMFTTRLMWHLGSWNLLSKRQYGFMPQVSTEDALFDAITIIKKEVAEKKIVAVLSLDIEGAFDGAWWPGILSQLIKKECPDELITLIDSYLSERSVRVEYAAQSVERETSKGCIQGSTCGPILWNVLMDPLLVAAEKLETHIQAFADDVLLIASASTTEQLNKKVNTALRVVAEWGQRSKLKFAAKKTQAIIVTRKLKFNTPRFVMSGVTLDITKELKVLGLVIDSKLTFKTHIQNTCNKAVAIYKTVATATRANWGLNPDILRLLYTAVVEPIVLYAASAWADSINKKYVVSRLDQLTRKFSILISKTHRTTSHSSALCLAGVLPLDLRVKEAAELFQLKRGMPFQGLPGREIERRVSPFHLPHPADQFPRKHLLLHTQEDVDAIEDPAPKIFTDGSKIEGRVGAAVSWWEGGRETKHASFTLASYCSVYQAELTAILGALELVEKARSTHSANIISDSRSALEAIGNPECTNPIAVEVLNSIQRLEGKNKTIQLYWIRAHEGIAGNERADELAKDAALHKKTSPKYDRVPVSFLRYSLRQASIDAWNRRYQDASTGAVTKLFFPDARKSYSVLRKIRMTSLLAQMFTGHGGFRQYLHRFKLAADPYCICDPNTPETVTHLLDECPRFSKQRLDLSFKIGAFPNANYSEFVTDDDVRRDFLEFAKAVVRTAARANGSTAV